MKAERNGGFRIGTDYKKIEFEIPILFVRNPKALIEWKDSIADKWSMPKPFNY